MTTDLKFLDWLSSFKGALECGDIDRLARFYQLPCIMSTPEKTQIYVDNSRLAEELVDILAVLNSAGALTIDCNISESWSAGACLWFVNVEWQMKTTNGEVFAQFNALYQLIERDNSFTISTVISYE